MNTAASTGRPRSWHVCAFRLALIPSAAIMAFAAQYSVSTIAGGAPPTTPTGATGISIGQPRRVAVDGSGNVYFSSLNSVFRVDPSGVLTLIAGNSRAGYSGDGGPATQAQLNSPNGLAFDSAGDLYIADTGNNVVREVTPGGIITTFAGTGTPGNSGDIGPATQALLHSPSGVAVDGAGNVYIADTANHSIREVTTDGNISRFAGNGFRGYSGDTGAATSGQLYSPEDVAVGSNGVVYIADTGNSFVRAVTSGILSSVAGNGTLSFSGDGAAATSAAIFSPFAVSVDGSGNIYIAEFGNDRIRKVDSKGIINTVAGSGTVGFSGDGSTATKANLNLPSGVAADKQGNFYIADTWNLRVRKVTSSGNISTVAGNGQASYSGDGGPATGAQLNTPQGVAIDSNGNIYVADSANGAVRQISPQGTINGIGGGFVRPQGVAVDGAGNIYVADSSDNRVRKITKDGTVTTFAGNGTAGFGGDSGPAASAQLNTPFGVAVDQSSNVYISEFGNNRVRKVASNGTITTLAGNGSQGYSGDNGPAIQASLNTPWSVAADSAGNVYIADTGNNVIREVTTDGTIHTIAGTGVPGTTGDGGPATSAQILNPTGVAIDSFGNLYFTDGSTRVREIVSGGLITTIAGNGSQGYSGDGGVATQAQFNVPTAVAVDPSGDVVVADTGNNAIRFLKPLNSGQTISAVTNAASNLPGPIAPGEIVVLYGSGLGPNALQTYKFGTSPQVATNLAGTSVLFNGTPGPVIYTSATQVAAVVPFGITGSSAQVTVQYFGQQAAPKTLSVAATAPAIFTIDSSGHGQAVALNDNLQPNSATNAAAIGSLLSLFATGGGQTSPAGTDGLLGAPPLPLINQSVKVTIGGQPATVRYAGGALGQVAGMMEITVQVPSGIQTGSTVPVTLQVGDASAPTGVTVAIK